MTGKEKDAGADRLDAPAAPAGAALEPIDVMSLLDMPATVSEGPTLGSHDISYEELMGQESGDRSGA